MKSAYEIAMERMNKDSGPTRKLSDEEKAATAEIDAKCDSQKAQTKLAFDEKLPAADAATRPALHQELAADLARIEDRRESEKAAVWGTS